MIYITQTRRSFLTKLLSICFTAPPFIKNTFAKELTQSSPYPVRNRLPNPYMDNGKPVVAIVHGTDFPTMLAKGMEILGGFAKFGKGKSVIVKPNFVFDRRTKYPTTTDENSVLTVVQYLQKEGFRDITVADRRAKKVKGRAGGKFEWSGLNEKAIAGKFKTDSLMDNGMAESVQVKDKKWTEMSSVGVIKKIYDAELIINMPTIKRHNMTHLTCSLKNIMGVLDGTTTENMHLWGDVNKAARDSISNENIIQRLCLTIAEAAMAVNPEMTIIDARQLLCKDHRSIAEGIPLEANCLLMSGDSLAADICASKILKETYEPYDLGPTKYTFKHAEKLGIGDADPGAMMIKTVEV